MNNYALFQDERHTWSLRDTYGVFDLTYEVWRGSLSAASEGVWPSMITLIKGGHQYTTSQRTVTREYRKRPVLFDTTALWENRSMQMYRSWMTPNQHHLPPYALAVFHSIQQARHVTPTSVFRERWSFFEWLMIDGTWIKVPRHFTPTRPTPYILLTRRAPIFAMSTNLCRREILQHEDEMHGPLYFVLRTRQVWQRWRWMLNPHNMATNYLKQGDIQVSPLVVKT